MLSAFPVLRAQEGEAIFKQNCYTCHRFDRDLTGPNLTGVIDRWGGDEAEMLAFIKNPKGYADGGQKHSARVHELFGKYKQWMTPHAFLGDDKIKAVITYIKDYKAPAAAADGAPATEGAAAEKGAGISEDALLYGLIMLVGLLVVVSLVLIIVIAAVLSAIRAKERGDKFTYATLKDSAVNIFKSKFVLTILALVIIGGVLDKGYDFAAHIGFRDGYQPVQPIAFSHKLHAGQYKINCEYCHTGVSKGKSATIPSTNICMNCHSTIKEGPQHGPNEIAKVVGAHEKGEAIEWVRIHNLPDLVYFSHQQHVKVAGLECQTCHGPIEEMEEVYQYSRLTMAWCVNCHRERKIDLNSNPYYHSVFKQVREDWNAGKIDSVSVARLGGLDCAKCHY
ncbi:MAG: c-type cytochrome [Bacteroidetes bacterium]|nr:c-type cytochrome [Bacteroidota bacterium]